MSGSCSGNNATVDNGRPQIRVDNGSQSAENVNGGAGCIIPGPSLSTPATISIPFVFNTTTLRVEMTAFPVYSAPVNFEAAAGGQRHLDATVRFLDLDGFEIEGAALVEVPEPGAIWLLGVLVVLYRK